VRVDPGIAKISCKSSAAYWPFLTMFAAAFGWIVFLTAVMPWRELHRDEVQGGIADLYKPFILIIGIIWILVHFLELCSFDSSYPSLGIS
jgi:uncharacterized membrane protein